MNSLTEFEQDNLPESDPVEEITTTPSTKTYYNMNGDWWAR